jgi:predicted PurR-regulated permease PerM
MEPSLMQDFMQDSDWRRRSRTLLVLVLIVLLCLVLRATHGVLVPYSIALGVGYLLLPAINWLDWALQRVLKRRSLAGALAILIVYLAVFGLIALVISMFVPVLIQQFNNLWAMRIDMLNQMQDLGQRVLRWYYAHVPPAIQTQTEQDLRQIGNMIGSAAQVTVTRTFTLVTATLSFIFGIIILPFWLFYILFDRRRIANALISTVPVALRADVVNIWRLVDTVLGSYIRGQLLLALAIGVMATTGLTLLRVPFPAILGLMAGLFELLPFFGPALGAIPALLVAIVQSPILAFWTLLLFVGIQQIENVVLAPRIAGRAVELHPAVIMVVLVAGNEIAGIWGMLIAVPVTAIVRDIFRYLYLRLQDEPCTPSEALKRLERA